MNFILEEINPECIPDDVLFFLEQLFDAGFESYLIGGAVRDLLLGKTVNDFDITTSANPEEISEVFKDFKQVKDGIKYGTVGIIKGKKLYEITSFRSDGAYLDHRHPESVKLTRSLFEDTKRRDFTINQIAYSPNKGIVDYHGGMEDLQAGIMRTVGEAKRRFSEDALRIMRCYRFAASLGFTIEKSCLKEAEQGINDLDYISAERIYSEFKRLLEAEFLEENWDILQVPLQYLLPTQTVNFLKEFNLLAFNLVPKNFISRLTLLLLGNSEFELEEIAKNLSLSKNDKSFLLSYGFCLSLSPSDLPKSIVSCLILARDKKLDLNLLKKFLEAKYLIGEKLTYSSTHAILRSDLHLALKGFSRAVSTIESKRLPKTVADLAIDGQDLLELGIEEGPKLGQILNDVWVKVVNLELENSREMLINWVNSLKL